ncbi:Tetratricopeptide-like helical domain [Cinara cedri]|uniref:Tetratricopeptide-like helical domain n=1 Tax=Cinara cedri TaxID=506608 RepID=A0A5E4M5I6_9HEMI|nr:Tetratricopeptide-like helical domain [Cinara cedri]
MEIKSGLYIAGILFALAVILTSTDCKNERKTGAAARLFNKVIGFTPKLKEYDITKLLDLILNDADLVKMAAYNKLFYLYKKQANTTSDETKKLIAVAMIRSTTELIKYYSVVFNYIKVKIALADGLEYAKKCSKIKNAEAECNKWKTMLIEAYVYRHKFAIDRISVQKFKEAYARAKKTNPDDKMINFLGTKVSCEVKLMEGNKKNALRNLDMWFKGINNSDQKFDCITELLKYENEIEIVGSYPGEYYYLLGRAYAKQKNNQKALECLVKARQGPIVCQKTRSKNKKVQELYEKLYIGEYAEH